MPSLPDSGSAPGGRLTLEGCSGSPGKDAFEGLADGELNRLARGRLGHIELVLARRKR